MVRILLTEPIISIEPIVRSPVVEQPNDIGTPIETEHIQSVTNVTKSSAAYAEIKNETIKSIVENITDINRDCTLLINEHDRDQFKHGIL